MTAKALRYVLSGAASPPTHSLGMAIFARRLFGGEDLTATWDELMARASASPPDPGAMLDLSTLLLLTGRRDEGLALQADAISRERRYRIAVGDGKGPVVLALMAPGDMMANTPLEFLLSGWNGHLELLFLDGTQPAPRDPPPHDLAIVAVGESDANAPILRALAESLTAWPAPILNGAPQSILALGRELAPRKLAGVPGLYAPPTRRLSRADMAALATDPGRLGDWLPEAAFPLIARPVGSHAGTGLEKLDDAQALKTYVETRDEAQFYLSPFVDYRSPDGLYRKLRVALIGGRPHLAHLAISEHWMVHYLNAGMDADPAKRAEEAAMMASFDEDFARRHGAAFRGLAEAIGLDYFAVDCAEDRQGRLLIFEADTAMIIHDMDPPDLYPYKRPAMAKLFAAFQALIASRL